MNTWTVVVLAGLATFAIRVLPVALLSTRPVPEWLERIGPLTAPVAFAALGAATVAGAASGGPGRAAPAGRCGGRRRGGGAPYPLDDVGHGTRDGRGLGRCRPRRCCRLSRGP